MMMMNEHEVYMYREAEATEQLGFSEKRKSATKSRFSDEQIKSLETIFESESNLDPRKKLQVARELGLQPRQVAIWFQNKRARYKSKQLEQDYGLLRGNYDSLAAQFESLKREKQNLQEQVEQLNDQMKKSREGNQAGGGDEAKVEPEANPIIDPRPDDDIIIKSKNPIFPNFSLEGSEHNIGVLSDEGSSIKAEYFGLENESEFVDMVGTTDSTLEASCQWWDVWS